MKRFDDAALSADTSANQVSAAFKAGGAAQDAFPYEDIVNTPWPRGGGFKADGSANQASAAFKAGAPGEFREHMSLDDRAKIFAPFAALKGFYEALACYTEEHERNR